jgi:non-heme chloroperoxidase
MSGTGLTFTTSDGVRLVYDDEGAGRPVLLVHGYSCNRAYWSLQRDPLLEAGHRVIALDVRGHGDSEKPPFGQRMSRLGLDLRELMNTLELENVTLIGHSMGVSVSLAMFSLFGTRDVKALVAIDQSPKIVNDEKWNWGVFDVEWPYVWEQCTFRREWGKLQREPATPPEVVAAQESYPHRWEDFDHEAVVSLLLDHFVADWRDVLPHIDVPTWVVTGRHNPYYHAEGMEWLAAQVQRGSYSMFEESGHSPHWNEFATFNRQLIEFLRSVS